MELYRGFLSSSSSSDTSTCAIRPCARYARVKLRMFQRHGKNCVPRNSLSGGDSAYLALPDRGDISRILSRRRASLSLGGDDTRAGGGDDGRRRCFLVPPLDSAAFVLPTRPPTFPPTADPHQRSLRTSLSLSLSLYVHIHGGENTHANFLDVSPGPCPQDIPRDAREFTGEERSAEREREKGRACAQTPPFILPLPTPRRYIFPPWIEIYCSDGTHTKILGRRASEKEGRSSVRISADSRSFSCLLSSHSPPSSRPTSVNRERGHKAYA